MSHDRHEEIRMCIPLRKLPKNGELLLDNIDINSPARVLLFLHYDDLQAVRSVEVVDAIEAIKAIQRLESTPVIEGNRISAFANDEILSCSDVRMTSCRYGLETYVLPIWSATARRRC